MDAEHSVEPKNGATHMTTTHIATLSDLLNDCFLAALAQGFDGDGDSYEYTPADLEYVTDMLGRKPSRQEWADAGLPYVGGEHCLK